MAPRCPRQCCPWQRLPAAALALGALLLPVGGRQVRPSPSSPSSPSSPEFLFGVSTAAYQVEGGYRSGSKGPSIWDEYAHDVGSPTGLDHIADGSTGDVADDTANLTRFREDVALMASVGVRSYRFSVSWPRVMPTGRKESLNAEGLEYYRQAVDALLEAKIEPFITLYHYDLPAALELSEGGWLNSSVVDAFSEYADVVFEALSPRVKYW